MGFSSRFSSPSRAGASYSQGLPSIPSAKPIHLPTPAELYIMYPICRVTSLLIPRSATNTSLEALSVGVLCAAYVLQWLYAAEHMTKAVPRPMYLLLAVVCFFYLAIRGHCLRNQAKAKCLVTRSEFFHRASQILAMPVFIMLAGTTLMLGPLLVLCTMLLLVSAQYVGHWRELYSLDGHGTAFRYYGPTEAVGFLMVTHTICYFTGPALWQEAFDIGYVPGMQVNHIFFYIFTALGVIEIGVSCAEVLETKKSRESSVFYDEQKTASMLELLPVVAWVFLSCCWAFVFEDFHEEARPLLWAIAGTMMVLLVYLTGKRLASDEHVLYHPVLVIPFVGSTNAILRMGYGLVDEFTLTCVLAYVAILVFGFQIISGTKHLRGSSSTISPSAYQSFSFDV